MNKQIAVIYSRVSTEEQGQGYSLPTQVESCRKYAIEKGYEVIAEFQDMHTGTELDRPGLSALYALIEKELVNVLLVHDIDRLSREVGNQAIIEMELGNAGVRIEYVIGQYGNNPEGELMKLVKSGIAQYENRQRAERSRRGRIGKAKAGYIVCPSARAPYGYTYRGEGHKSWFTVNKREADVVRLIYTKVIEEGWSSHAIAKYLWQNQIPTKGDYSDVVYKKSGYGEWSPSTVSGIISNSAYKGVWYYGKTRMEKVHGRKKQVPVPKSDWISVSIPAIVSEEVWDKAQKCLEKNRQQAIRNTKRFYLLRSMVFCQCGRRWTAVYKTQLQRGYYRCPTGSAELWRRRCEYSYSINQYLLETVVWEKISNLFLEPELLMQGLAEQREESRELVERKNRRSEAIVKAIQETDRKLSILLDQVLTGEFAQSVIDEKRKALMDQRAELEAEMYRLSFELEKSVITTGAEEELLAFAKKVSGSIKDADLEMKRRILELVQTRVNVLGRKKIEICCLIHSGQIVDLSSIQKSR